MSFAASFTMRPTLNRPRLLLALPAEQKDLLHEVGRAAGTLQDGLQVVLELGVVAALHLGHLRVADDRAQDVVEVVGDAAGQGAHGLKLVGLGGVLFHLDLAGHVATLRDLPDDAAGGVPYRRDAGVLKDQSAVLRAVGEATLPGPTGGDRVVDLPIELRGVLAAVEKLRREARGLLRASSRSSARRRCSHTGSCPRRRAAGCRRRPARRRRPGSAATPRSACAR